jgi:hypothetical protein
MGEDLSVKTGRLEPTARLPGPVGSRCGMVAQLKTLTISGRKASTCAKGRASSFKNLSA